MSKIEHTDAERSRLLRAEARASSPALPPRPDPGHPHRWRKPTEFRPRRCARRCSGWWPSGFSTCSRTGRSSFRSSRWRRFTELYRIRCALEGLAGELATANIRPTHLSPAQEAVRGHRHDDRRERDSRAISSLNQKFHFLIYERAEVAAAACSCIQDRWSQVGPFFNELFEDEAYLPHARRAPHADRAALEDGDAAGVRQASSTTSRSRPTTPDAASEGRRRKRAARG